MCMCESMGEGEGRAGGVTGLLSVNHVTVAMSGCPTYFLPLWELHFTESGINPLFATGKHTVAYINPSSATGKLTVAYIITLSTYWETHSSIYINPLSTTGKLTAACINPMSASGKLTVVYINPLSLLGILTVAYVFSGKSTTVS